MTNRPWNLETCLKNYSKAGVYGITVWRNLLENKDLQEAGKLLEDNGMNVVSLARGGFFPSADKARREAAISDNLLAIEQAVVIGAPLIVLVCGADPRQSLEKSREQIAEGILKILPAATNAGIRLGIEPLHPMYAGDRSAINTLRQANDMADLINSEQVGVVIDVYHLWWDDRLHEEINRSAVAGRLFAFHVSDWNVPTVDLMNDRGLMGDGCINIPKIRDWMEENGFSGFSEVEIFSEKYWAMDQTEFLAKIKQAYLKFT